MGGGASVAKSISAEWMDIFRAMKLRTWEVQKLYDIYNTVDADRSGSIDVVELLMFLDIERTLFTERIFEAFDKDHTHRVDFYEFVVSVWKFCILSNEAACKRC
jgi:Ca2+-binding EF-hand superfamily protein